MRQGHLPQGPLFNVFPAVYRFERYTSHARFAIINKYKTVNLDYAYQSHVSYSMYKVFYLIYS